MLDRVFVPRFLVAVLVASLTSCVAPPRPETSPTAPEPAAPTDAAAATIFEIVSADISVQVYRAGPLAELGHNHVIASTGLVGRIELREPLSASTLKLALPLGTLTVDEPARRAAAGEGFPDNLTESDRDGTRRNMLGPSLLDAGRFPVLELTSLKVEGDAGRLTIRCRVNVAGGGGELLVPVMVSTNGDELAAHGTFTATHGELGLAPFSAAMGALRVRDDMRISYQLVARRADDAV